MVLGTEPKGTVVTTPADTNPNGKGLNWVFDHTKVDAGVNVKITLTIKYTCGTAAQQSTTWSFFWDTTGDVNKFAPVG